MAKNVDPDQSAPEGADWSVSSLFAHALFMLETVYQILGHLL